MDHSTAQRIATEFTSKVVDLADDPPGAGATIGRYVLHRQIARGGMATIHIARLLGDEGFSRIVAAKRLLPEFACDADFVEMFLDEARIASKVHHRNVVPVLDLVNTGDEVVLVQEYVHGAPLHWLLSRLRVTKTHVPIEIAMAIASQVLEGLHAAHETVDEMGEPLGIVHRDVSPQNVMIGVDGTARLLDFGVAKATMAAHVTREGVFKGKLAYSAPEQLRGAASRQSDIYSMAVVLWELLVGHRMHQAARSEPELITAIMTGALPTITEALADERDLLTREQWLQLEVLEPLVKRGLAVELRDRWPTAAAMQEAIVATVRPATTTQVAAWVKSLGKEFLDGRDRMLAAEEASWRRSTGTSAGTVSRRTPVPGELQRATVEPVAPPVIRGSGRSPALYALLGALVLVFAVLVVILIRRPEVSTNALIEAVKAAEPETPTAKPVHPTEVIAPPVHDKVEPAPAPVPEAIANEPTIELTEPDTAEAPDVRPAVRTSPRPTNRPARPRVVPPRIAQPQAKTTTTAPTKAQAQSKPVAPPVPSPAAVVAPTPAPAGPDCSTPYFFEGGKKVFKPACL